MKTWGNILIITVGIAIIKFAVDKLRELRDDYGYYSQDVQRYIDSR